MNIIQNQPPQNINIVKINSAMNCQAKLKMLINTPQFQCLVFTHLDVHSPMMIFLKEKTNHFTTYQKETGWVF